ncbi:MAG: efflux RND transporter permease subunit [Planctomycetaceae bacterium]|nr:efflux RND transporter permease subunit [Planctomycetaceae bacterium]
MHLVDSFIRNPVKVTVGVLIVVLFGVVALLNMPKQLTPRVVRPVLTIETQWPGASPQEVEREIIQEQEEQLQAVEGVLKMTSTCNDSGGRIVLEFAVGTDMSEALLRVNTNLQQVREYPEDASEPRLRLSDTSDSPIARFFLSLTPPTDEEIADVQSAYPELQEPLDAVRRANNPGLALLRLNKVANELGDKFPTVRDLVPEPIDVQGLERFIEDNVSPRFERISGVSDVYVYGGTDEELQIIVDPEKLAAREITITQIREALRGQNKDTSSGDFWEGKRRWVVRVLGQFDDPEDVANQLLAVRDGAPVYIRDVAEVRIGFKKPDGFSRRYGTRSLGMGIQRQADANVLEVMADVYRTAEEVNEQILGPMGLTLFQQYDETEYIESSIALVQQNIYIGGALTLIVLMMFLNRSKLVIAATPFIAATAVAAAYVSPWFFVVTLVLIVVIGFLRARGALVVGLAIPTSIVGTFLMMGLFGRSLNVISLSGMAFAVGMLVDSAVVVLENIFRRHEEGESPFEAAARGTEEVWGAVIASTLTTIAVFVPVLFIEDVAGQLFRDIALAISCAVGLSMLVSFTLIPTLSARLFVDGKPHLRSSKQRTAQHNTQRDNFFVRGVVGLNGWIQRGIVRSLAVILLIIGGSFGLTYALWPAVDYLPNGNRNMVIAMMSLPPGYNINHMMAIADQIDEELRPYWDTDLGTPEAAALDAPVMFDYFFFMRRGEIFLGVRSAEPSRVQEFIPVLQRMKDIIPGTQLRASSSSLFDRGLTSGRSIDIEISGPELPRLIALGQEVMKGLRRELSDAQAFPQPSLDLASPELQLTPRRMQTAEMGVSATELGYTVDALLDGAYAGDFFSGGDKIDMTIKGNDTSVSHTQDLEVLPIATPDGQLVPLGTLADLRFASGPQTIVRRERQRAITIGVTPPPEMALEEAMTLINTRILDPMRDGGAFAGGYRTYLAGTADQLRQSWQSLQWNLLLALAITYLLMAALFESWLYPFVIIMTVPLGAVGGLIGLAVLNLFILQPLDVLTMLGFVILIGTVVNNAILIVHQSLNHMRDDGMPPSEAIPESVRTRIRPIFITTATTVLGLLPLVIFPGSGSELYRGLGSVVLGGLIVSTIFTLVLVPTVFALTMRARMRLVRLVSSSEDDEVSLPPSAQGGDHPSPEAGQLNGEGAPSNGHSTHDATVTPIPTNV